MGGRAVSTGNVTDSERQICTSLRSDACNRQQAAESLWIGFIIIGTVRGKARSENDLMANRRKHRRTRVILLQVKLSTSGLEPQQQGDEGKQINGYMARAQEQGVGSAAFGGPRGRICCRRSRWASDAGGRIKGRSVRIGTAMGGHGTKSQRGKARGKERTRSRVPNVAS